MIGTGHEPATTSIAQHYELVRVLGIGGMAEVLLAKALDGPQRDKLVALKRLLLSRSEERAFLRSLINEARVASELKHPGIVQVYGFEVIDHRYCLVMEYIDGITLEDALNCCRINAFYPPFGLMAYIFAQVCVGLDYLHHTTGEDGQPLKLVHRDIKPSNIMLCSDGQVKLLDFGVAKATNSLYNTTAGMGAKGTLAFMSPEQLAGGVITGASDLFSLGISLYEAIALDPLYDDRNLAKLTQDLYLGLQPEPALQIRRLFPALEPILARLLQAKPEDRYASALELKRELDPLGWEQSPKILAEWVSRIQMMPGYANGLSTATSESARETAASLIPGTMLYGQGGVDPSRAMAELLGSVSLRHSRAGTSPGGISPGAPTRPAEPAANRPVNLAEQPASTASTPVSSQEVQSFVVRSKARERQLAQDEDSQEASAQASSPASGTSVGGAGRTKAAAPSKSAWGWWGAAPPKTATSSKVSRKALQEHVLILLSGVVLSGLVLSGVLAVMIEGR